MRQRHWILAVAVSLGFQAIGQAEPTGVVTPVAFSYDDYYRQGDEFLTAVPVSASSAYADAGSAGCCEPTCGAADACGAAACCDSIGCADACGGICGAVEGFSLAGMLGLSSDSAYEIGGWTNIAYYDNNTPLSVVPGDGLAFQDYPDHANLAQQWFYLGRTVDGSAGWDLGGRIDAIYGVDAQKTQAFGNPTSLGVPAGAARGFGTFDASLDHGVYGWAIPQAYAEIAAGDLSVKVGHFFTPAGYEVIPATGNFFMSHSYTMFNSEPFTHSGALATYTGFEALTLYGGWSAGWDTGFDQFASGSTAIGGFATNLSENVTFTYINTYGNFGWRDLGGDDSYAHSCVLTVGLTDNLQYIAQSDYLRVDNDAAVSAAGLAGDTVGVNQYLIYKLNDVVSTGGRVEWWKADGVSYNEVTGGFNIHALNNLVFRPEARKDWAPAAGIDEETFGVDAILVY
jgi:hypothetical protein